MNKILLSILIATYSINVLAQDMGRCYTTPLISNEIKNNPEYQLNIQKIFDENKVWLQSNNSQKSTLTIPVVVHIVHRQTHANIGVGTNIPIEQIEDGLRILNEDYSKTNSEFPNPPRNTFLNVAGNPNLQFCLATEDPNGFLTTGVTRTSTAKTSFSYTNESNDMKKDNTGGKSGWPPSKYLNIWICDIASSSGTTVLGYAYLPGLQSWNAWKDGLVVDFQYFGTNGNSASSSDGRTPTHEIGHYLGLNHTFCESQSGGCCDNDDSNVYDTPATDGVYFGSVNSNTNNNSCNDMQYGFNNDLLDMDENYMAYSRDTWMFTNDQVNEMNATLNGYRQSLKNSNVSINCTGTVSNENIKEIFYKVYPNPSNGIFNIESIYQIDDIQIFDLVGNIIYTNNNLENRSIIDLSKFRKGVYILHSTINNTIVKEKIIITK
ncbi:MAG: zinc-dependent metalloprotease [Flavobacteriales bacterium]|jgi:hypothetical protein|tara:strand:+ start:3022 stop:4326 length:1305 start_codon:yes stop_codon:yes gene_type:complete